MIDVTIKAEPIVTVFRPSVGDGFVNSNIFEIAICKTVTAVRFAIFEGACVNEPFREAKDYENSTNRLNDAMCRWAFPLKPNPISPSGGTALEAHIAERVLGDRSPMGGSLHNRAWMRGTPLESATPVEHYDPHLPIGLPYRLLCRDAHLRLCAQRPP